MRTTITIDDDLAQRLKELARTSGRSFNEVTNEVIRVGLTIATNQKPFQVEPKACGFKPGVDLLKLNQTYDDLEIECPKSVPAGAADS